MLRTFGIRFKLLVNCGLALAMLVPLAGARASGYRVLRSLSGRKGGSYSSSVLVADAEGDLYGTTERGGGAGGGVCARGKGCGTVFKVTPKGKEIVLHAFAGGGDGNDPMAGLVMDTSGNLYGTTYDGGSGTACTLGCGTVFKVTPDGGETVLYSFAGKPDGASPWAGLILDGSGNLYGTTVTGGSYDEGTVFKLAPDGTQTDLYSFTGGSDGGGPIAPLIFDGSGNLYGETVGGGASDEGTVFELKPGGNETVLYSFAGKSDGAGPAWGLLMDAGGNFYGTTLRGGGQGGSDCANEGCGTVFELAANGSETVLHAFTDGNDGGVPWGGVIADGAGNLYGTGSEGGATGRGLVFELAPGGSETVLYSFCSQGVCADGDEPLAGVIADNKGNLYGTTALGGNSNHGVVFTLPD